jgi:DNA (cytosine-5)-methyltransferase 1
LLSGLDLFSGIGGIALALKDWVIPVAYCENDKYAIGVLLSRMQEGKLPFAPIWDDVRTLKGARFHGLVDIVYGGFPCQDISVAGTGKGLGGERSGLFFEIVRLVSEIRPKFVFLENVPAIRNRGADRVVGELARLRYDTRWITLSASEIGANHRRERWWLLAHTMRGQQWRHEWESKVEAYALANHDSDRCDLESDHKERAERTTCSTVVSPGEQRENLKQPLVGDSTESQLHDARQGNDRERRSPERSGDASWWSVEPDVGRVAHGVPNRVDKLKCLGNAVVPECAKEAFKRLMGL